MNLMLFNTEEFVGATLRIRGERARELIRLRQIAPGDRIRVGQYGGLWGWGTVSTVLDDEVNLSVELNTPDNPKPITLIIGLPRPQILKKVLQTASMMGVSSLVLVRSARSEKSFLQSPLLREEQFKEHLRLGLEQGIGTIPPQVRLFSNFGSFSSEWLEGLPLQDGWRLVAEPRAVPSMKVALREQRSLRGQSVEAFAPGTVAIGPEGGWQDEEIEAFNARGFRSFQLGNRILRVDIAVPVILGQLALLTEAKGDPGDP